MPLFTPEQLQRVREIIDRHHKVVAVAIFGAEAVDGDPRLTELLEVARSLEPDAPPLIDDAFVYAQLLAHWDGDVDAFMRATPETVLARLEANPAPPLTDVEKATIDTAKRHAGAYCVGLGTRVASTVVGQLTGLEASLTPDRIRDVIRDETAKNREARAVVSDLKSNLGHEVGNWTRDWLRIATSETNDAIQDGTASTFERDAEERGDKDVYVSKLVRPDACRDCKRLYLGPDGEPKIFKLSELRANGTNVGRKREAWLPTVGNTHPWCGCQLVRVPKSMRWENGEMVVKSFGAERPGHKYVSRKPRAGGGYVYEYADRIVSAKAYTDEGVRELHHALKDGDDAAAARMAEEMAPHVPPDAVLVPMPGRAGHGGAGLRLARHLARLTGRPLADALRGNARASLYEHKKGGGDPRAIDLGLRQHGEIPPGTPVIVDNVVGTGTTARAAQAAIPGALVLVHAVDHLTYAQIEKAFGAERPGHKYLSRRPKPGGGWEYEYAVPAGIPKPGRIFTPDADVVDQRAEAREAGVKLSHYFASGSNHEGEIQGFASLGWNVGVAAHEVSPEAVRALHALKGKGTKVFVDSGAFSEVDFNFPARKDNPKKGVKAGDLPFPDKPIGPFVVEPITDEEWNKRLDLYERLAESLGPQLYAVAPDKVAFQEDTGERLAKYAERVRRIHAKGANILVPLQKGKLSLAEFDAKCSAILGFDDYVRAIPMKKDATTTAELEAFMAATKPKRVHLLGLGEESDRYAEVMAAAKRASPETEIFLDSVKITSAVERPKLQPNGTWSRPRKLTAATDRAIKRIAATAHERDEYFDNIRFPSTWLPKALRESIATTARMTALERKAFVKDPTAFIEKLRVDDKAERASARDAGMLRIIDVELDGAWTEHYAGVSGGGGAQHAGRGSTAERKREAIREAFGGEKLAHLKTRAEVIANHEARARLTPQPEHRDPEVYRWEGLSDAEAEHREAVAHAVTSHEMTASEYAQLHEKDYGPIDAFVKDPMHGAFVADAYKPRPLAKSTDAERLGERYAREMDRLGDIIEAQERAFIARLKQAEGERGPHPAHDVRAFQGFPIVVENMAGSPRAWGDPNSGDNGVTWMHHDYGFIAGTEGADGEDIDCYIGPDERASHVYVVHQKRKLGPGRFEGHDEDKVMLGFSSETEARRAYLNHYDDPRFLGSMTAMPVERFRRVLERNEGKRLRLIKAFPRVQLPLDLGPLHAPDLVKAQRPGDYFLNIVQGADDVPRPERHEHMEQVADAAGLTPKGRKARRKRRKQEQQRARDRLKRINPDAWRGIIAGTGEHASAAHSSAAWAPEMLGEIRANAAEDGAKIGKHRRQIALFLDEKRTRTRTSDITKELADLRAMNAQRKEPVRKSWLVKSGGPFIGPKGGKWANPEHTIPWQGDKLTGDHAPKEGDVHEMHVRGMHPFEAHIAASKDDDKVRISQGKDGWGTDIPKASVKHFLNDLRGVVDAPKTGDARVDAVIDGKAEHLGKGDDGIAFKVGDHVVKVSTTVPYQPFNPGHRSPSEAADMLAKQAETSNKLADEGVPGFMRSEIVRSGEKTFVIRPHVDIPEKLTRAQLDSVAASVLAAHKAGYAFNDEIQVGVHDGKLVHFDTGKVAPSEKNSPGRPAHFGTDQDDDIRRLKELYRQHGERYLTDAEKQDPTESWEALLEVQHDGMSEAELRAHRGKILKEGQRMRSFVKNNGHGWLDEDLIRDMEREAMARTKKAGA